MSAQHLSSHQRIRRSTPLRAALVLTAAVGLAATPAVAMAGPEQHFYSVVYKDTSDGDPGGSSGSVTVHPADETRPMYAVQFQAKGENLYVKDFSNLKSGVVARVYVWDKAGDLVDKDVFRTKKADTAYNLGYPDGSGNIPDGSKIAIKVESPDSGYASDLGHFTA